MECDMTESRSIYYKSAAETGIFSKSNEKCQEIIDNTKCSKYTFRQLENMLNKLEDVMLLQCTERDRSELIAYLEQKAAYHTFLLSDITLYGFDHPHQKVFAERSESGEVTGVYLRYFNNLILAGDPPPCDFVRRMKEEGADTIMGPAESVRTVGETLDLLSRYVEKRLLTLHTDHMLMPDLPGVQIADIGAAPQVHQFLMEIPAFRQMYASVDMVLNRMKSGEGMHMVLLLDGQIVAHANSAARTRCSCMLGGLAVEASRRGRGIASALVSSLCRQELLAERHPSVFSELPPEHCLFHKLGFEETGKWGVLNIK